MEQLIMAVLVPQQPEIGIKKEIIGTLKLHQELKLQMIG